MMVRITAAHNTARLAGTLAFLATGQDAARITLYAGAMPAEAGGATGELALATITLASPPGAIGGDGLLHLTAADEGLCIASGIATWARIVAGDGAVALDVDVSDEAGGGALTLANTQLYLGGGARLLSAEIG